MIQLDFGNFNCRAELHETETAENLINLLPVTISLTGWGNELYGPVDHDLGETKVQPTIPSGGIAYTRKGNYICIFFGQAPAWEVEHIGDIVNDEWRQLLEHPAPKQVVISLL